MPVENLPEVVSRDEWLAARKELLAREKELTRHRDEVNAARRRLPMVRIDKPYTFAGPDGTVTLIRPVRRPAAAGHAPLHVEQRHRRRRARAPSRRRLSQLLICRRRHRQPQAAACSQHHAGRGDPGAVREDCRSRTAAEMADSGHPWTASMRGDWPGISAFLQVDGVVYHTYSAFGRGIEEFHNGDPYLDLTAFGRQEPWEEPQGRAAPLGLQAGGPNTRLPDEYGIDP
jgi:predicted dithiol-disulfide oxidoreductase (DUF899 family)